MSEDSCPASAPPRRRPPPRRAAYFIFSLHKISQRIMNSASGESNSTALIIQGALIFLSAVVAIGGYYVQGIRPPPRAPLPQGDLFDDHILISLLYSFGTIASYRKVPVTQLTTTGLKKSRTTPHHTHPEASDHTSRFFFLLLRNGDP